MSRRLIGDSSYWLGGCMKAVTPDGPVHYHVSTFLVLGSRRTALIDTGDPHHWDQIRADLVAALDGRRLDYIVPTHPELPHAGNLPTLLAMFPDSQVVGDVRDYPVHYPEYADRLVTLGVAATLDLGDRRLEIVEAYIRDLPNTVWAYDPRDQVLYVSDGFSFIHDVPTLPALGDDEPGHLPGQCRLLSTEMPVPPTIEQAAYGTGRALYWTRYVDVTPTFKRIREFLNDHPVTMIAPAHGNVISDVAAMMDTALAAHRMVLDSNV
jgi:flavorubredoxin